MIQPSERLDDVQSLVLVRSIESLGVDSPGVGPTPLDVRKDAAHVTRAVAQHGAQENFALQGREFDLVDSFQHPCKIIRRDQHSCFAEGANRLAQEASRPHSPNSPPEGFDTPWLGEVVVHELHELGGLPSDNIDEPRLVEPHEQRTERLVVGSDGVRKFL